MCTHLLTRNIFLKKLQEQQRLEADYSIGSNQGVIMEEVRKRKLLLLFNEKLLSISFYYEII